MQKTSTIEAYPLTWPIGYKRTPHAAKKHAQFQTSFASARDGVIYQLKKMGAKDIIISSNVPIKRDGLPYSVPYGKSNSVTDDAGIAVYFNFQNDQKVLCCDAYHTLDDNMHAINKTVEALRGIDRWQVSEILTRAFTGFTALPETITLNSKSIWEILGLNEKPASSAIVHQAYKQQVKKVHPDAGGSVEGFHELQVAYNQALSHFNTVTV